MQDLYLSVDVEADGPVPGPYSLLSIGACTVGLRSPDGRFAPVGDEDTFYGELRPTGTSVDRAATAVSGLDRDRLAAEAEDAPTAMSRFGDWVSTVARRWDATPVFCAWPLGFDWMFVRHYFVLHAPQADPFGHGNALDMKTWFLAHERGTLGPSAKQRLPEHLRLPLTHDALGDARAQAALFRGLIQWYESTDEAPGGTSAPPRDEPR